MSEPILLELEGRTYAAGLVWLLPGAEGRRRWTLTKAREVQASWYAERAHQTGFWTGAEPAAEAGPVRSLAHEVAASIDTEGRGTWQALLDCGDARYAIVRGSGDGILATGDLVVEGRDAALDAFSSEGDWTAVYASAGLVEGARLLKLAATEDPCVLKAVPFARAAVRRRLLIAAALAVQNQVEVPLPGLAQAEDVGAASAGSVLAAPGVFAKEPRRRHHEDVRVAVAPVVDRPVDDDAAAREGLPRESAHEVDLGFEGHHPRQRPDGNAGELRPAMLPVHESLGALDVVPEPLGEAGPGHSFRGLRLAPRQSGIVVEQGDRAVLEERLGGLEELRTERGRAVRQERPRGRVVRKHDPGSHEAFGAVAIVPDGLSGRKRHPCRMMARRVVHGVRALGARERQDLEVRGGAAP